MEKNFYSRHAFILRSIFVRGLESCKYLEIGVRDNNVFNTIPLKFSQKIGVDPENKKTGLGKALAITGLNYLNSKSLKQAMLYVDADNAPALAMYQGLGFN